MARSSRHTDYLSEDRDIVSRLDLIAEYTAMGVKFVADSPRASGKIACYARGRDERRPSAYVDTTTGRYADSGGQGESLSLWDFAALYGPHADWQSARRHFAHKAGVTLTGKQPRQPDEALDWEPWSAGNETLATIWCQRHKPGASLAALRVCGARIAYYPGWTDKDGARHRGRHKVLALPVYAPPDLVHAQPVAWVIFDISGGFLEVFRGKGESPELVKMKSLGPTSGGLMGSWHALDALASGTGAEVVWKTAGPSDMLAVLTAIDAADPASTAGHHVVTNASGERGDVPPALAAMFSGRQVNILHDADEPGELGAAKWVKAVGAVGATVRHVRLPYEISANHGRDVRDYLTDDRHSYADLLALYAATPPAEPPPTTPPAAEPTPSGQQPNEADDDPHRLARVFLRGYRHLRYWRQEWWTYTGTHYTRLSETEIRGGITRACKQEFDRLNVIAIEEKQGKDGEIPKAIKVTQPLIGNVAGALAGECGLSDSVGQPFMIGDQAAGQAPQILALRNGLLDLDALFAGRDDVLRPHTPDWFSATCLPYDFDPRARCPRWQTVLQTNMEGDDQRMDLLQEWAGYLLVHDTSQQKFMMLEGEGSNGKSVYCALLRALIGDRNCSHVSLEMFAKPYQLSDTLGKLACIVAEVGELDKVAEGLLKSFTSGDRMMFERKYKDPVAAVPTARLLLATNNRPRFADRSSGIWRRMLLVPFRREISDAEKIKGMDAAPWWEASGELPGVLNWALAGLARLRERGQFTRSEVCDTAVEDYRADSNPARRFLLDHCHAADGSYTPSHDLYRAYREMCGKHGFHALSIDSLGREIARVFPGVVKRRIGAEGKRSYVYDGLEVRGGLF